VEGRTSIDVLQWKQWYRPPPLASCLSLCIFVFRSSFDKEDDVVIWFWEYISESSHEERKRVWNWTTGMKEMPSETTRM
jgi:hypothetical protein